MDPIERLHGEIFLKIVSDMGLDGDPYEFIAILIQNGCPVDAVLKAIGFFASKTPKLEDKEPQMSDEQKDALRKLLGKDFGGMI